MSRIRTKCRNFKFNRYNIIMVLVAIQDQGVLKQIIPDRLINRIRKG